MRYIQSFSTSGAVQEAVTENQLGKPYIAYIENEHKLDWNEYTPRPEPSPLEIVWDSGSTPEWYDPANAHDPAYAYHKARFNVLYNGQLIDSGDTGLSVHIGLNLGDDGKWIEIPRIADGRGMDGWFRLYWHNGGEIQEYSHGNIITARTRSFDVVATYSGLRTTTNIVVNVQPVTGITFFGIIAQSYTNTPFLISGPGYTDIWGMPEDIIYEADIEYAPGTGRQTSESIANQYNSDNHGSWSATATQNGLNVDGDFSDLEGGWYDANQVYYYHFCRTGGTGIDDVNVRGLWCGLDIHLVTGYILEPVDPMVRTPLTLEVTDTGTSSQSLYFRFSGSSRYSAYTKNIVCIKNSGDTSQGGWTREINMSGGTYASSKIDVFIDSGMSVGDKYEFFGMYNGYGGLGFAASTSSTTPNAIEYFVCTSGLRCKVYGNINSLLTDSTFITDFNSCDFTMNDWAFSNLFDNKTGFTFDDGQGNHLVLPSTSLSRRCYRNLFAGCTSMTSAPELPATTLNTGCYNAMFSGCTALVTPPALPATTLTQTCYVNMFAGCSSLVEAPELPASTYAANAYLTMFRYCSSLNYVKCLLEGTEIDIDWLNNVSSTGTFVKHPDATWVQGTTGRIPTGWTIEDAVL